MFVEVEESDGGEIRLAGLRSFRSFVVRDEERMERALGFTDIAVFPDAGGTERALTFRRTKENEKSEI